MSQKKLLKITLKNLPNNGYHVDEDSHLFPNKKTKEHYDDKTLKRHFKKHFGKMTFDNLRAYGIQRKKEQLEGKTYKYFSTTERIEKIFQTFPIKYNKKLNFWGCSKSRQI